MGRGRGVGWRRPPSRLPVSVVMGTSRVVAPAGTLRVLAVLAGAPEQREDAKAPWRVHLATRPSSRKDRRVLCRGEV